MKINAWVLVSGFIFLIFFMLKTAGIGAIANLSWWWILSPLWILLLIIITVVIIVIIKMSKDK